MMASKRIKSAILYMTIVTMYATCTVLGCTESDVKGDSSCEVEDIPASSYPFLPANSNDSISYLLYTPERPNEACFFEPDESNECTIDPRCETKVLVHGYTVQLLPGNYFKQIKDALLEYNRYNVIIVNWTKHNGKPYAVAVAKAYPVAINVGKMINFLVSNRGVNPSGVHIIGHSLGAHVAGVAGKQVPNLGRVTGLDPAGPLFNLLIKHNRLTNASAELVDVMHTSNSLTGVGLGIHEAIGTIDFYPNGGNKQPACQMGNEFRNADGVIHKITSQQKLGSCLHNIALPYFLHSIQTCIYPSFQSENYETFSEGKHDYDSNLYIRMGFYCEKIPKLPAHSKFYLNTSADPPYCENE